MSQPQYHLLKELGLSKTAINCYQSLFEDGSARGTELAERLNLPRTGLYRILKRLEQKGFVIALKTENGPTYFYAEPLHRALERYAEHVRRTLSELIIEQKTALAKRSGQ